jgi:hypothetical protein
LLCNVLLFRHSVYGQSLRLFTCEVVNDECD